MTNESPATDHEAMSSGNSSIILKSSSTNTGGAASSFPPAFPSLRTGSSL